MKHGHWKCGLMLLFVKLDEAQWSYQDFHYIRACIITCVDSTSICTVVYLWLIDVSFPDGLVLPISVLIVAAFILTAAVVILQLLSQDLVVQSCHDRGSPEGNGS